MDLIKGYNYHKFNLDRILSIKWHQDMSYDRKNKAHAEIKENIYVENIGKRIFETIFLGNNVNYHKSSIKDGLYYYLKLFGIDSQIDHFPLKITKDDVEEHLSFRQNDKILEIL